MKAEGVCNGAWEDALLLDIGVVIKDSSHSDCTKKANYVILKGSFLAISDLHIGIEQYYDKIGMGIFVKDAKETCEYLYDKIVSYSKDYSFETIILNGDIMDEYSLSSNTRIIVMQFIKKLSSHLKVVMIRGNHDVMIDTLSIPKGVEVADFALHNNALIVHGDRAISDIDGNGIVWESGVRRIIMGHEHPAISVYDGIREERLKSFFLCCDVRIEDNSKVSVLVLPSSNPDITGSPYEGLFYSPLLRRADDRRCHVIVRENNDMMYFGTLSMHKKY